VSRTGAAPSLAAQRTLLDEDRLGTICHKGLAWLLTHELPLDEPHAVFAADAMLGRDVAVVYRASLRAWVAGATVRYERHFRRSDAWRFLGAEVIVDEVALDMLWVNFDGRVEADELKTGLEPAGSLASSLAQAIGQARAAAAIIGSQFQAVRLVVLNDPQLSAVIAPDGSTQPLFTRRAP
jgi:hypothetical protein